MSSVIDFVGDFLSSSASAVADAVGSDLSSFLSSAGTALSVVGALSGEKDLMRIGGFMSLGGLVSGFGTKAPEPASSAWDSADSAAQSDAAQFGKYGQAPIAPGQEPVGGSTEPMPSTSIMQRVRNLSAGNDYGMGEQPGTPLVETARQAVGVNTPNDPVAASGSRMTSEQLRGLLDKTKSGLGGVGQFVKDNKELLSIVGSAFGPQAELVDLRKQQAAWDQSLLQRRMRNLNAPVVLGPRGPVAVPGSV